MERIAKLNDHEYRIIQAVREATENQTKTASADLQHELGDLYYELAQISGSNWEEVVRDVRERIYRLLY